MAEFLPFHGVLPVPEHVAEVAAVPYDVVNTAEAAALAAGNPLSFLHVSRPEIDMEPGIDPHSAAVYEQGRAAFERIRKTAPLLTDADKHLYIYRLTMNGRAQTGVIGAAAAADYRSGVIKKHEKTRADKEDDRTRQVMSLRSHTGPAFFTYRGCGAIDELIAGVVAGAALFDFTAPDGVRHELWRIDEDKSAKLSRLFAECVPVFYIADGHHRSAAAARTAAECAPGNLAHTGKEDYNYFLAVAFPADQLAILPYNRVVRDLNGLSREEFIRRLEADFTVSGAADGTVAVPGEFKFYIDGVWQLARPKFDPAALGVIGGLDVSWLQNRVLGPLLGVDDPRTSRKIDFIGGIRGTGELERLVNSGEYAIAFSLHAVTVDQLMRIADAGEIMPPKSTWFEPKLRDGLVCHDF